MITAITITRVGQFKKGDFLLIQEKNSQSFPATVKEVLNLGTGDEEIIFSTARNKFFNTGMYLKGQSWVQSVVIVHDCKATCIINNFVEHR